MPSFRPGHTLRRSTVSCRTPRKAVVTGRPAVAAAGRPEDGAPPPGGAPAPDTVPVPITFLPSGATTAAPAGTDMMAAAAAAGVDLPAGCYSGSCGLCEVEVSTRGADGALLADRVVQRACVSVIPSGVGGVTIAELEEDAVWGQDGWDT